MKTAHLPVLLAVLAVILLFSIIPECSAWDPVIIEVPGYAKRVLGTTNGTLDLSWYTKRPFNSFRSLFYASPPTKQNRFLPPVPNNYPYPDDEIYNAQEINLGCPQGDFINEDCLVLTIYTPYLPGSPSDPTTTYDKNLPVLYWIYGGSFTTGQNIIYQPQTLMEYDMVIVQVQYRLGPFGFLSLDTDEVPGNAAMFDQIEGLRWVNKFIKYFGGDPNKVTLMGQSAGGASVSFVMLAPQARGLFHGVIAEAGSMLAEWALDRKGRENGLIIADYAGCPLEPYRDLLECLRTVDVQTLRQAQRRLSGEDERNGGLGFGGASPVIQIAGAQKALTREPRAILDDGDYDTNLKIMFGANKHEGIYVTDVLYRNFLVPNGYDTNEEFLKYDLVPTLLNALGVSDDTGVLADTLYDKYFSYAVEAGQEGNFSFLTPGMVDLGGALFLKAGGYETVRIHSKRSSSSYWYSFDYRGKVELLRLGSVDGSIIPSGVGHADELMYLWNIPLGHRFNESESLMCHRMQRTWANFVRFGNPSQNGEEEEPLDGVPEFLPYDSKNEHFMAINSDWEMRSDYTNYYTVSVDDLYQNEVSQVNTETGKFYRGYDERRRHPRDISN